MGLIKIENSVTHLSILIRLSLVNLGIRLSILIALSLVNISSLTSVH